MKHEEHRTVAYSLDILQQTNQILLTLTPMKENYLQSHWNRQISIQMDDIEKLPLTSLHRVIHDLHPLEVPNKPNHVTLD